jgi:hypothetical protein
VTDFKALIQLITDSVNKFNKNIPGIQRKMLDDILLLVKQLDIKDDRIKISGNNLRLIAEVKSRLQSILLNKEYQNNVKAYIKNFDEIIRFQNDYFSKLESKFTAPKLATEIKKQAINSVVNSLTENGLNANIVDKVHDLMRKATTSGGSYSSMNKQLSDFLINNESGDGQLLRYTKQITTDALNQFSGQYTQLVSSDLGFEWFRYSGSNIQTSRPFCLACTDRKYFHISELPKVLKGDFPEFELYDGRLNKNTQLPEGMIPGTDVSNFMINRGGYNCGHQWRPVSEDLVPNEDRLRVYSSPEYRAWAIANGKKVKEVEAPKETKPVKVAPVQKIEATPVQEKIKQIILTKHADELKSIQREDIDLHEDLLLNLGHEIAIERVREDKAFYSPIGKKIVIGEMGDRLKSEYFKKTLMAHELGHAIHNTKEIIHRGTVSPEFQTFFKSLKKIIAGKEPEIEKAFWDKYRGSSVNAKEQLMVIYDIIGSLTKGRYGGGHEKSYYNTAGKSEAEVFAHAVSLLKVKNNYEDLTPEVKAVIEEMRKYISDIL